MVNKDAEKLLKELEVLANKLGFGDIAFLDEKDLGGFEYCRKENPNCPPMVDFLDFIIGAGIFDLYKYIYIINVVAKCEGLDLGTDDLGFNSFDYMNDNYKKTLEKFGDGKIKTSSESRKELASLLKKCYLYLSDSCEDLKKICNSNEELKKIRHSGLLIVSVSRITERTKKLAAFFEEASKTVPDKLEAFAKKYGFSDISFLNDKEISITENLPTGVGPAAMEVIEDIFRFRIDEIYKYVVIISTLAEKKGFKGKNGRLLLPGFFDEEVKESILEKFGSVVIDGNSELVPLLGEIEEFLQDFNIHNSLAMPQDSEDVDAKKQITRRVSALKARVDLLAKFFKEADQKEENKEGNVIIINEGKN